MENLAKVIIFTMAYNAERTIQRTIESILNQTYSNFKYFILDNASTDKTEEIIYEYAGKDERIVPIHVNKNDPPNGGAFFHTLVNSSDADYIVWCDADDSYKSDFLEKTIEFARKEELDIVSCGYEKIDGITGSVVKRKASKRNLVLYDELFELEFITYRGYMSYLWGKLFSISFLRAKKCTGTSKKERICNDTNWVMGLFKKADRVGIYGEPMYQYYQYPRSLSHTNIEAGLSSYHDLWVSTKEYIESYGPVSKLNEDFLYAIHLSLVEEAVGNIFGAELDTGKKLELLEEVFSDPVWRETITRDADPMFHSLANRSKYVAGIKDKILSLPGREALPDKVERVLSFLEGRQ